MDRNTCVADQLDLIAGHVRLLAHLMLAGPDLQDVDRGAFAQVLHDLAVRLERATGALEDFGLSVRTAEEAQP